MDEQSNGIKTLDCFLLKGDTVTSTTHTLAVSCLVLPADAAPPHSIPLSTALRVALIDAHDERILSPIDLALADLSMLQAWHQAGLRMHAEQTMGLGAELQWTAAAQLPGFPDSVRGWQLSTASGAISSWLGHPLSFGEFHRAISAQFPSSEAMYLLADRRSIVVVSRATPLGPLCNWLAQQKHALCPVPVEYSNGFPVPLPASQIRGHFEERRS